MKKTYNKHPLIMCLLTACTALSLWLTPIQAHAETLPDFDCSYSVPTKKPYFQYGASEIITYTEQEAKDAGIPEGYSGTVVSVKPVSEDASGSGILLDFTAWNVPVELVEQISFRFYLGESTKNTNGKPQLRIMSPVTSKWMYQPGNTASVTGEWATETVKNEDSLFKALADENGNLDKFELSVRVAKHVDFYIDSVTLDIAENDGVAPEIRCANGDAVSIAVGSNFDLGVSAYDAQEKRERPLEYIWENGVELDANGVPNKAGEYSLTVRATDYYGNQSQITMTVTVIEPDLEAPVIHLNFTEMYAQVGMIPLLNVRVTDNQKVADVTCVWSDGALDANGALTEGTHTFTVTATDDSNNQSVHTITVFVTKTEHIYDNVIDEEALSPRYTVTFDGENPTVYKYGEKVQAPADPVREDTAEYTYVFEGWYNGEVKWDFSEDRVVANVDLVAKWTAIPLPQGSDSSDSSSSSSDSSSEDSSDSSSSDDSSSKDSSDSSSSSNSSSKDSSTASSSPSGNSSSGASEDSSNTSADENTSFLSGCLGSIQANFVIPALLCACLVRRRKSNKEE